MWKVLTQDIGLKIAALLLAVFVWVNAAERRPVEMVTDIPVWYVNMPAKATLASKVPDVARVRIRGSGIFMRWRLKDVHVAVDLSPAERGVVTHVLSPAEVVTPSDQGLVVLEVLEPKAIKVELDELTSKEVAVRPVLSGALAVDKVLVGLPTAAPERVALSGAEHVLAALTSIPTVPIDVGHLARKGRVTAKLDLSGLPPVSSDIEEVLVSARIEPRKEIGIPAVPLAAGGSGLRARFAPETVDLVIAGGASLVDSLDPRSVKLLVETAGLPAGQTILTPVVEGGRLHFKARSADRPGDDSRAVAARLDSPFILEVISVTPGEIGLVLR
jgi:YbbR domain-containing protein